MPHGRTSWRITALLPLLLTSCIPPPRGGRRDPGPPAAPPVEDARALRQCLADLSALGAKIESLPDRTFANGCSATASVKLVAIGIPIANLGAVKCGLARALTLWVQQDVQRIAQARLGTTVSRIESYGTFACRPVNNVDGNRLSEHGRANAVDLAAFTFADRRRVTVLTGWNGPDPKVQGFLRDLHAAACRRFNIVLGPEANAYHRDHLHFDMGSGRYCR